MLSPVFGRLGVGFSGEPPVAVVTDDFSTKRVAEYAYDTLIKDLQPSDDEKLYLLIGHLDYTNLEDTFILAADIVKYASTRKAITHTGVGMYAHIFAKYGFFITILCADEKLDTLLRPEAGTFSTESFIL